LSFSQRPNLKDTCSQRATLICINKQLTLHRTPRYPNHP
jgi:hypothetical protein